MFASLRNSLFRLYVCASLTSLTATAQNNTSAKWHFGNNAGIDFMTTPPTAIVGSQLSTSEGCSGISDPNGNLLFYTDGITVWTSANTIMANGTGLDGNSSSTQAAVVVKQPGNSNIYFIFTLDCCNSATGVKYSVVDMNLAAGLGSVTVLNVPLAGASSERLTSVKHCNGIDTWVLSQDVNGDFRSHLVTAAGVAPTFTTSTVPGNAGTGPAYVGYMKFSPNGRKLGLAAANDPNFGFELYDFDATTGIVSNRIFLLQNAWSYGVEFSPDGTKMYGALWSGPTLYEWDLCAGNGAAIAASVYTTATVNGGALQLARDGKIYMTRSGLTVMGEIPNPNAMGAGNGYIDNGQSIAPNTNSFGLPNFITSGLKPPPPPFTSTVNCMTANFTAPLVYQNYTVNGCAASGYSLTNIAWNFGDPASGAANTSTVINPSHNYSGLGTFTANLILYFSCGGGTDTIKQAVIINQPCVNVVSNGITCNSLGSASVTATFGTGPYSYYWLPSGPSTSVISNVYPGTYSVSVYDFGTFTSYTVPVTFTSSIAYTGTLSASPSVPCFGSTTGTASILVSGGTGTQNYYWYNGSTTVTTPTRNSLPAGNYTVTVIDAVSSCSVVNSFSISQPPNTTLSIAASGQTLCVNSPVTFTATNNGGTPGYTYSWTGGPQTNIWTTTQATGGNYVYTVTSRDTNQCQKIATVLVNFVSMPVPTITPNYTALCVGSNLILSGSGGIGYSWAGPNAFTANTINTGIVSVSQAATGIYTLTVTQGPCTATVTQSITVYALPTPSISAPNICEMHNLQLTGYAGGGITYTWTGPATFRSNLLSPVIPLVTMVNDGLYTLTVTDANNCVGVSTYSIPIRPNPVLLGVGQTVCFGTPARLSAMGAVNYTWTGPNNYYGYTATITIPAANSAAPQVYTVTGIAANGCTASVMAGLNTNPLPTPNMTITPRACVNGTVEMEATGGLSYTWRGPYNFSSVGQKVSFVPANSGYAGVYTVTASDNIGCQGTKTGNLILDPLPQGDMLENIPNHCVPFCSDFNFQLRTAAPLTDIVWSIGIQTFSLPGFSYCFNSPGTYPVSVRLSDSNGCQSTIGYAVDAYPVPKAGFVFNPENPIEGVSQVEFVSTSEGQDLVNWNWSFIDNNGYKPTTERTSYIFDDEGTYPVALVVRNAWACSDTIVKAIKVESDFALYVPNAFTPNEDEDNEIFQAKGFGIVKYTMSVYTRWGQKVFETNDFSKGWDGTFKGESCKADVYIWKVDATNTAGKEHNLNGYVTLYR